MANYSKRKKATPALAPNKRNGKARATAASAKADKESSLMKILKASKEKKSPPNTGTKDKRKKATEEEPTRSNPGRFHRGPLWKEIADNPTKADEDEDEDEEEDGSDASYDNEEVLVLSEDDETDSDTDRGEESEESEESEGEGEGEEGGLIDLMTEENFPLAAESVDGIDGNVTSQQMMTEMHKSNMNVAALIKHLVDTRATTSNSADTSGSSGGGRASAGRGNNRVRMTGGPPPRAHIRCPPITPPTPLPLPAGLHDKLVLDGSSHTFGTGFRKMVCNIIAAHWFKLVGSRTLQLEVCAHPHPHPHTPTHTHAPATIAGGSRDGARDAGVRARL